MLMRLQNNYQKSPNYMKKIKAIFMLMAMAPLYIQATDIKGHFASSTSQASPYQVVMESCDTLHQWKVEGTFYEPSFNISTGNKGRCTLKIMQQGKVVYCDSLELADTDISLGDIKPMKTVDIAEVEVKAKKINIRRDGRDYTISNIQGTHLGNAGNLVDMLKWTPGVTVSRNGQEETFDVLGRGEADVYVNGRKVKTSAELRGQKSNLVTKIEIIRDPDVQYSGSTNAVIRITTRRPVQDYLGASLYNRTTINRKARNSSTLDINGKQGIVSGNVSLGFDHDRSLSYTDKENTITHSTSNVYHDLSRQTTKVRGNYFNLFTGLNFNLSKKSMLAVQYSGGHHRSHPYSMTRHSISDNGASIEKDDESFFRYSDTKDNNYTAGYTYTRNASSTLNMTASYTHKSYGNDKFMLEHTVNANETLKTGVVSRDVYNFYTFDGDYSFKIKNLDMETVGAHFGHILNRNPYTTNGVEQLSRRNDTWVAAYFKGGKTFKNGLSILFGLRYEYDNSTLSGGENNLRTHSSFFIPNVRLKYRKNGNSYQLQYLRSASNPPIYRLNPVVEYIDSLHYSTGNPSLRSYYGNKISASSNIGDLSFSMGYTWGHNSPIQANILEKGNVIKYMPICSDLYTSYDFDVDYSIDSEDGKFSSSFFAGFEYVTNKYTANGKAETNRQTSLFGDMDLSWSFAKNWEIFGEAFYQSPRINGGARYGYQLDSKIGISTQLFKRRLRLSLEAKDFFNRSVAPTETEFTYLNVYERVRNRYDSRGVSFSLRYNFNGFSSRYRRANSDFTTGFRTNRQ